MSLLWMVMYFRRPFASLCTDLSHISYTYTYVLLRYDTLHAYNILQEVDNACQWHSYRQETPKYIIPYSRKTSYFFFFKVAFCNVWLPSRHSTSLTNRLVYRLKSFQILQHCSSISQYLIEFKNEQRQTPQFFYSACESNNSQIDTALITYRHVVNC